LRSAYQTARQFYKLPAEQALDVFKDPPARPEPVEVKKEPKVLLGKRKTTVKRHEHRDHDDREMGHEGDLATGANLLSSDADDMDAVDELDSLLDNEPDEAPNAKRLRPMETNEVVFNGAQPTQFKSKDQVVLIRNPNGTGLWPALVSLKVISLLNVIFSLTPSLKKRRLLHLSYFHGSALLKEVD
jgi:hypothetical protein